MSKRRCIIVSVIIIVGILIGACYLVPLYRNTVKRLDDRKILGYLLNCLYGAVVVDKRPISTEADIRDILEEANVSNYGKRKLVDKWGHEVKIRAIFGDQQVEVTLIAAGPDGLFGTRDDFSERTIIKLEQLEKNNGVVPSEK